MVIQCAAMSKNTNRKGALRPFLPQRPKCDVLGQLYNINAWLASEASCIVGRGEGQTPVADVTPYAPSSMVTVVPTPAWPVSRIVPPWIKTIFFASASPRPNPCGLFD